MFGFFRKKNKDAELPEKEVSERKKKPEKDQGPTWASLVVLGISVLAGAFFWIYGQLSSGGFVGVSFRDSFRWDETKPLDLSGDNTIIFEK